MTSAVRDLLLVLGDQLDVDSAALRALDAGRDAVLMIEAPGEANGVWSHKARIALFLSAMRHHRDDLRGRGLQVIYVGLDDSREATLAGRLDEQLTALTPAALHVTEPGDWRVREDIETTARARDVPLHWREDGHFLCSTPEFSQWASRYRGSLRMEYFYREMRKRHHVLMAPPAEGGKANADEPEGGQWNYDADNRKGYPRSGPGAIAEPAGFAPDALTQQVFADVERHFPGHPGSLDSFRWPVTREQARTALQRFVDARLAHFGPYQDAMWSDTPFGWHSLLSTSMNLHLLDPREVIAAAEAAYRDGRAPLASAEGFIRQVLGWREFIRGVYWLYMPDLAQANHYDHRRDLPAWYWTGETQMACLRDAIGQTLEHGYAHHIQRLMVTGLFALLAEVQPQQVAAWYLAVYVDAVEWAELPNVAGMALYADGGAFTSKPYVASGAYIDRMSNHCKGCRYRPTVKTGPTACPFTVLYWHFLDRHEAALAANGRTALMAKNVARLDPATREGIRTEARRVLSDVDTL